MKILSDAEHKKLKEKADNYDAVVNAVVASGEGITPEDVNPDVIAQALNTAGDDPDSDTRVSTLETEVRNLTAERDNLKAEVEELRILPGSESVTTKKPLAESSAVVSDELLDFANKNKGNTLSIAAKMVESGFVNTKLKN